jgi:hypothetical protein
MKDVVRADGKHYGANLRWSFEGEAAGQNWEKWQNRVGLLHRDCSRLYVYEGVKITGNAIDPSVSGMLPTYVLKTLPSGTPILTPGAGQPFALYTNTTGFFETSAGSGVALDSEPYWYETCQLGGYEDVTGSHWYQPTIDFIDGRRDEVASPLANGTYRYLIVVRSFWQKLASGAAAVPFNRGRVAVEVWKAQRTG